MRATLAILVAAALLLACHPDVPKERAKGSAHVEGTTLDRWDLEIGACSGATVNGHTAVRLTASKASAKSLEAASVLVSMSREYPVYVVLGPGMEGFSAEECTVSDIDVHHTGVIVDDFDLVRGRVRFDCQSSGGLRIWGEAEFEGCR